jgi:diadenosine tetraphosphate (Ap4A) HIT family hydrolase
MSCELCETAGGDLIWQDAKCRVVRVADPDYPGFCRVIWREHRREMTDLSPPDRAHLMQRVFVVESALRSLMKPDKINLASLGNLTPHLHWHVIPRFLGDRHFPRPVWAESAAREYGVAQFEGARIVERVREALNGNHGSEID